MNQQTPAAIVREAPKPRQYNDAVLNFIFHKLDGVDGKVSASMSMAEIADILVQHESRTVLAMIEAASPEWADALRIAGTRFIRIH